MITGVEIMTEEQTNLIVGLKLGQKEIDGKKRIVLEDKCSIYYQDDKGIVKSELKKDSPCCGVFSLIKEIETYKKEENEEDDDDEYDDDY
jgi:hypothetical protein